MDPLSLDNATVAATGGNRSACDRQVSKQRKPAITKNRRLSDFQIDSSPKLRRLDVLCTRAFRATSFGKGHRLTFTKLFEGNPIEIGHVEEQIVSPARADEAKTLFRQFLDRTFRHLTVHFSKNWSLRCCLCRLLRPLHRTTGL